MVVESILSLNTSLFQHITSTNAESHPAINPHYYEQELDVEIMLEAIKFIRGISSDDTFKCFVVQELNPGISVQTDDQLRGGFFCLRYLTAMLTTTI